MKCAFFPLGLSKIALPPSTRTSSFSRPGARRGNGADTKRAHKEPRGCFSSIPPADILQRLSAEIGLLWKGKELPHKGLLQGLRSLEEWRRDSTKFKIKKWGVVGSAKPTAFKAFHLRNDSVKVLHWGCCTNSCGDTQEIRLTIHDFFAVFSPQKSVFLPYVSVATPRAALQRRGSGVCPRRARSPTPCTPISIPPFPEAEHRLVPPRHGTGKAHSHIPAALPVPRCQASGSDAAGQKPQPSGLTPTRCKHPER